jgi:predicted  nucleic acid-binding Zn-ribbon protein
MDKENLKLVEKMIDEAIEQERRIHSREIERLNDQIKALKKEKDRLDDKVRGLESRLSRMGF